MSHNSICNRFMSWFKLSSMFLRLCLSLDSLSKACSSALITAGPGQLLTWERHTHKGSSPILNCSLIGSAGISLENADTSRQIKTEIISDLNWFEGWCASFAALCGERLYLLIILQTVILVVMVTQTGSNQWQQNDLQDRCIASLIRCHVICECQLPETMFSLDMGH